MNYRVRSYVVEGRVEAGAPFRLTSQFSELDARASGTRLETDGIGIMGARALIAEWNRRAAAQGKNEVYSIPLIPSDNMTSASDYYYANAGKCSALLGCYLFEEIRPTEAALANTEVFHLCVGDREWISVAGGLKAVIREVQREVELNDQSGIRNSELPEDWGVIANDAGQILARASTNGGVCCLRYLGVDGGPMESAPITVQRIGIAWDPGTGNEMPRQRG